MASEVAGIADVILRDGRTLRLRPPRREDAGALVEFFGVALRAKRLPAVPRLPEDGRTLVEPVLEPDWEERGALLGTLVEENGRARRGRRQLRAPARPGDRRGGVRRCGRAPASGHRHSTARATRSRGQRRSESSASWPSVLADNRDMLGVFESAGSSLRASSKGARSRCEFPIAPTEHYRERVAERDHTAVTASLRPFFEATSVAVVGASRRRGSIGGELFRNILAGDFTGVAYPVNRDGKPVAGVRGYRSIEEIPDAVDLAVICAARGSRARGGRAGASSRVCGRSSSSRPDSPRSARRARRGSSSCSRSCARTAPG